MRRSTTRATIHTRPWAFGLLIALMLAWASIGVLTGHNRLLGPFMLVHVTGWSALLLSAAIALFCASMVVRLVARPRHDSPLPRWWPLRRGLTIATIAIFVAAFGSSLAPTVLDHATGVQFIGTLDDHSLRALLLRPAWADAMDAVAGRTSFWMKLSLAAWIVMAVFGWLLGLRRDTIHDHPIFSSVLLVLLLPFAIWISAELASWALRGVEYTDRGSLADETAIRLFWLLAVSAFWFAVAFASATSLWRLFGGQVEWTPGQHVLKDDPRFQNTAPMPNPYPATGPKWHWPRRRAGWVGLWLGAAITAGAGYALWIAARQAAGAEGLVLVAPRSDNGPEVWVGAWPAWALFLGWSFVALGGLRVMRAMTGGFFSPLFAGVLIPLGLLLYALSGILSSGLLSLLLICIGFALIIPFALEHHVGRYGALAAFIAALVGLVWALLP